MTDEVNDLIQNAFENPALFSFECSSSGLTQDFARLNLGENNRADKILSNAEKFFHSKTKITACLMRTSALGRYMEYCLHTQMQILQITDGKNW